jgi:hypothetical protein
MVCLLQYEKWKVLYSYYVFSISQFFLLDVLLYKGMHRVRLIILLNYIDANSLIFYDVVLNLNRYLDDTLLIDLVKKWMKCLRTKAANTVSMENETLFVKIPALINNLVQLLVQKGIRVPSLKPCVHHLIEDIFNSLSYCFLCYKEANPNPMDFLGYILCDTTR